MKKYILGIGLFSLFTQTTFAFSDITITDPYYPASTYLEQIGVFKGYEDGSLGRDKYINRAESLKTILTASDLKLLKNNNFKNLFLDVPLDTWFSKYVYTARDKKVVSGDGSTGNFVPARTVNKAEFMKMALIAFEVDTSKFPLEEVHINDVPEDAWFSGFMKFGVKYNILNVNAEGNILPGKELTRAEVADILFSILKQGHGLKPQKLLDISEQHLVQAEKFIQEKQIPNATILTSIAERFALLADFQLPKNNIIQSAIKTVDSLKSLIEAFLMAEKGDKSATITASKRAWSLAAESLQLNPNNKLLTDKIKNSAAKMAALARGE